jgi:hypothetical protein
MKKQSFQTMDSDTSPKKTKMTHAIHKPGWLDAGLRVNDDWPRAWSSQWPDLYDQLVRDSWNDFRAEQQDDSDDESVLSGRIFTISWYEILGMISGLNSKMTRMMNPTSTISTENSSEETGIPEWIYRVAIQTKTEYA